MTDAIGAIDGLAMPLVPGSGARSVPGDQSRRFRTMLMQGGREGGDLTDPSALAAFAFNNLVYATGVDVLAKCAGSAVAGVNKLTSVG